MQQTPVDPRNKQPEDGTNKDMNLTNNDATLVNNQQNVQQDMPTMSDNSNTNAVDENMKQSALPGDEINPEFGDAADPTFEAL